MFSVFQTVFPAIRKIFHPINTTVLRSISTFNQPLYFRISSPLCGAPMRKKKKGDPALERLRNERKRRKIYRQVRRLQKLEKQCKPIEEIEVPYILVDEREKRLRTKEPLNVEVLERRTELLKQWKRYKTVMWANDLQTIDNLISSQKRALDELRLESEELYQAAIQIDETLVPITFTGPTNTPPIKDYESPDGEYVDETKVW